MKFDILNRYTGSVQFTAEIDCAYGADKSVKVGLAVKWGLENKANLRGADLRGADLGGANLGGADLGGANLMNADLRGADLGGANLWGADLWSADLMGANLGGANLVSANLMGANLWSANLGGADLWSANLGGANLGGAKNIPQIAEAQTSITPEGQLIGWKKCRSGVIVKLSIPAEARRSNATGRKCRAEFADCIEVFGAEVGVSKHDKKTEYRAGDRITCDKWCDDRWQECAGGIHFFLTREEAENY